MMNRLALCIALSLAASTAMAQTYVNGYTRKDGTYVAPHVRSNPNSTKSDNYGASERKSSAYSSSYAPAYSSPHSRDKDNDGISNQNDSDDDNDGLSDDNDPTP